MVKIELTESESAMSSKRKQSINWNNKSNDTQTAVKCRECPARSCRTIHFLKVINNAHLKNSFIMPD